MQRVSLQAILQDLNGANAIFDQIKKLAVKSPFQFKDLISYTKQLSAFSIPMSELYETTKMLSDVSAGLGVGMDRIILAYGQIRSASVLRGQEIRQLTEAGIPVIEELRKQFEALGDTGITASEVFDKVSARLVPFEMIKKMFQEMTSEGGKFYMMQEKQADTLKGKVSNLTDAYHIMLSEIGERGSGILNKSVDTIRSLFENYDKVGRSIIELTSAYGVYKAVLISANAIDLLRNKYAIYDVVTKKLQIKNTWNFIRAQKALNAATLVNPYMILAAGVAVLGYSIYKLITYQTDLEKSLQKIKDINIENNGEIIKENIELDRLYKRLNNAKKGTYEYIKTKETISRRFDAYLTQLREEGKAVGDVADAYDDLRDAIERSWKQKGLEKAMDSATNDYISKISEISKSLDKALSKSGLSLEDSEVLKEEMLQIVRGEKSFNEMSNSAKSVYESMDKGSFYLKLLDSRARMAKNTFDEAQKSAKALFDTVNYGDGKVDSPKPPEWFYGKEWEKRIGQFATTQKYGNIIEKRGAESPAEYISRIRDEYNKTTEDIELRSKLAGENVSDLREKLKALAGVFKILGISPIEDKAGKKEKNPIIDTYSEMISIMGDVDSAYQSLLQEMSKEQARIVIGDIFGDIKWINFDDLENRFQDSINATILFLKTLGEEGEKEAKKLEDNLSKAYRTEELKRYIEQQKEANKIREEEAKDLEKIREQASKWADEYASIEEKILILTKERDEIISKLSDEREISGVRAEYQNRLDALSDEAFQLTEIYTKLYGDITALSKSSLKRLISDANQIVDSARTVTDKSGKKGIVAIVDGKEMQFTIKQFDNLKKKVLDITKSFNNDNPFSALGKHLKKFNDAKRDGKQSDWFSSLGHYAELATAQISALGGAISEMVDSLGNESLAEDIGFAVEMMEKGVNVAASIAKHDYLGAAVGLVQGLTSVFRQHDKRMERRIKASQRVVREYEMAYTRLSKAMDKALGSDRYKTSVQQFRNLKAQTDEIKKQIALEERKKKTDKDKVQSLRQQLQDLQFQMGDIVDDMREQILGGDAKGIAQKFGDALFDAIISGKDAASALKETIDDIVKGIAKTMLIQKLIEKPLSDIVNKYSSMWYDSSDGFLGFDKVMETLPSLTDELSNFGKGVIPVMEKYINEAGFGLTGTDSIGREVSTIQEKTANLLSSYINAIRGDVSFNKESLVNISKSVNNISNNIGLTLAQLQSINSNTLRSARSAESILDKLNALTTNGGTMKLNTRTFVS
jgi:tape measure domain-containing protein